MGQFVRVVGCILYEHSLPLVLLAALVCIVGALVTIRLFRRTLAAGHTPQLGWLFLTGVCAGSSIWATHFIAMLGYDIPVPVTFDPTLTIVSILVAVVGATVGLGIAARAPLRLAMPLGGAVLGLAIAAMHYTGMFAYRVEGIVSWSNGYIAASLAMAVGFAAASLGALQRWREGPAVHAATALLVISIVTLHFTGMTAFEVSPMPGILRQGDSEAFRAMALAVALVGFIIVGTGTASHLIDKRTRQESEEQLRHMALHDPLTGLPNRTNFNRHVDQFIAECRAGDERFAVVGIDLNRFKEINDSWGHAAGDEALALVAERIAGIDRDGIYRARVGGDEFFVAAKYASDEDLESLAEEIESLVFAPISLNGSEWSLGGSLGVAVFPRDGVERETLIRNADLAMYRAKADPTENICFYDTEIGQTVRQRRALANDLREAIERDDLSIHYQVQTSVEDGGIIGYEALLRWTHPERGPVSPAEFIPLAESNGLILSLGDWVLRRACRDASRWEPPYRVAVNLSPVQLTDANLPRTVHEILVETGLPPARLELELTETALINDKIRSLHAIRQIKALGVSVALDDFGTGYSSLDTLRSFPFDKIKLDRSFVDAICTDPQSLAIVRAVTALGRSLSITVLAEGIETEQQLSVLKEESCHGAQGFLLGRPMPVEQLLENGGPRVTSHGSAPAPARNTRTEAEEKPRNKGAVA